MEIDFHKFYGGPIFSKIKIEIDCNRYTQLWLNTHPTYKIDCKPLLLFTLKDFLLEHKLAQAPYGRIEVVNAASVDKRDPRLETYFTISLEILDVTILQNWLMPLANLANSHIDDQLRAFFIRHPECRPTKQRTNHILKEQKMLLESDAKAEEVLRRSRREKLPQKNGAVHLFADESGDPGFKDWESCYLTSVAVVDESKTSSLRKELLDLIPKYWKGKFPTELHFSKIPASKKEAVAADIARLVNTFDVKIYCFEAIKSHYLKYLLRCEAEFNRNEELPVKTLITSLPSNPKANIVFNFLSLLTEELVAHVGNDALTWGKDMHLFHDRKHRSWMNDALNAGVTRGIKLIKTSSAKNYGALLAPTTEFTLANSEQEPCLWIADWFCSEIIAWQKGANFSSALESCLQNAIFIGYDNLGKKASAKRPGGEIIEEFPDTPREIPIATDAPPLPEEPQPPESN